MRAAGGQSPSPLDSWWEPQQLQELAEVLRPTGRLCVQVCSTQCRLGCVGRIRRAGQNSTTLLHYKTRLLLQSSVQGSGLGLGLALTLLQSSAHGSWFNAVCES
jgi:hypothetical protein